MIKLFDKLVLWTIYPIVFGIILGFAYFIELIFFFKIPEIKIKEEFKDTDGAGIGFFAHFFSWVILIAFIVAYFTIKTLK
jgi:hypothetical protein